MNTRLCSLLSTVLLSALPAVASAEGFHPGHAQAVHYNGARQGQMRAMAAIDREQQRQHERIMIGLRRGELTRPEARRLLGEQRAIAGQERRYLADGRLTHAELADLRRDLSQSARRIERERRDWEHRREWR